MTEWRDVPGFEGLYKVTTEGKIYSLRRHKWITQTLDRYGYLKVVLFKNGKSTYTTAHRVVASAYIPNPENKPSVNHINEDKADNRVCNLEWVTVKENDNHGTRNERMRRSKLVRPVIGTDPDGVEHYYEGVKDAFRATGIYWSQIRRCCTGIIPKTTNGFTWRYADGSESEMGRFTR